jgi:prepilin-type processing-associated H-X9-DG protein
MTDENNRIEIDDLPRAEKELTDEEEKGVSGGTGGVNVMMGDGSVRFTVDSTPVNTTGGSLTTDVSKTKP